jgi:tetratricopeptide (TPR) repeat protein
MSTSSPRGSGSAAANELEARVWQRVGQNKMAEAVALCQLLNRDYPRFASGWHTSSRIAMSTKNPGAALKAIAVALALEPDKPLWRVQHAICLGALGRFEELKEQVVVLTSLELQSAYENSALGLLLTQLGDREQALHYYKQAAVLKPDEASHFYNVACMQRTLGALDEAEENFDKAISLNPHDYESWKTRSELRHQTVENNHVNALEGLLGTGAPDPRGKVQICYALAKELEDLGEFERSFHHLKQGADLRRSQMKYDVQRDLDTLASIQETFQPECFARATAGSSNDEPIFILGMPRTGTTLVERILASHSDVFAAGELNNFSVQMMGRVHAENGGRKMSRDDLVRYSAGLDFVQLGEAYVASTRPFTGSTPRFIDKLPLNYLYVGLIHLALPRARIVLLQRHPMDTCYAIYKQLFVDAYPFSYSQRELGQYFVAYQQLIEHWQTVLPGVLHTVQYEALVADTEPETRKLLEFCALDWQEQCLRFYENKSASATASTAQVRQPVYTSSVGKWKNYRQQLAELVNVLTDAGIKVSD